MTNETAMHCVEQLVHLLTKQSKSFGQYLKFEENDLNIVGEVTRKRFIKTLADQGIISRRVFGPRGAYRLELLVPADSITLADLFELLGVLPEPFPCKECMQEGTCKRGKVCQSKEIWGSVNDAVRRVFESVTLRDLLNQ